MTVRGWLPPSIRLFTSRNRAKLRNSDRNSCARRLGSPRKPNPAKGEGIIVSRGRNQRPQFPPPKTPTSFPLFCCSVPEKSGEVATRCPQRLPAFVHSGQRSRAAGPRHAEPCNKASEDIDTSGGLIAGDLHGPHLDLPARARKQWRIPAQQRRLSLTRFFEGPMHHSGPSMITRRNLVRYSVFLVDSRSWRVRLGASRSRHNVAFARFVEAALEMVIVST